MTTFAPTLIVGLGNPGDKYQATRHNVGFEVVEAAVHRKQAATHQTPTRQHKKDWQAESIKFPDLLFLKPQTFMNNSGLAVRAALNFYDKVWKKGQPLPHLVVIHDDLDLPLGKSKLQFGKGPKVHNGLLSLYDHLGTTEFWHFRIGVDGRQGDRSVPGHVYVLQPFLTAEQPTLEAAIAEAVSVLVR